MKRVIISEQKMQEISRRLSGQYSKIPQTVGCMQNISKEGGCGAWCCATQSPSLLYSQFLHSWNQVLSNFTQDQIVALLQRAIWNYLSNQTAKGCVMFNTQTKTCTVHNSRPFNCRHYCQISDQQFSERKQTINKKQKTVSLHVIRDQCKLPQVIGKPMTRQQSDAIWSEIKNIENFAGIPVSQINDHMSGSYRTFHDHIMLHMIPGDIMQSFEFVKLNGDMTQKLHAVLTFMDFFKSNLQKNKGRQQQIISTRLSQVQQNEQASSGLDQFISDITASPKQKKEKKTKMNDKNFKRLNYKLIQRKPKKNRTGW